MAGEWRRRRGWWVLSLVGLASVLAGCATTPQETVTVVRPKWSEPAPQPSVCTQPSIWPLLHEARQVTSGFGYRRSLGGGGQRLHRGIDIAAPRETPVVATAPGRVAYAEFHAGGYGNLIIVEHDTEHETWYAHLNSIRVNKGQDVDRGEVIGGVGRTGRSTGYHLHYEVRLHGEAVNPQPYME